MTTITIPKEITKNKKLVAVPSQMYEEFLAWQKKAKSSRTFKPTASEKKALTKARMNFKEKKYITLEELEHELAGNR